MNNISHRTSFLAKIALFIVAILWGTSLTVVKSAADVFKPNFLLGIRFTIAGIILAVIIGIISILQFKFLSTDND